MDFLHRRNILNIVVQLNNINRKETEHEENIYIDRIINCNCDHRNYIDLKKLIPYVNLWQNCIYKAFLSPVNTL